MNELFGSIHGWGNDDDYNCSAINKTSLFTNAYNGIPETLMLNVLAWILLVVLFTLLRHQAGDYGRLALVNNNNNGGGGGGGNRKRWTDVFYSHGNSYMDESQSTTTQSPAGPSTSRSSTGGGGGLGGGASTSYHSTSPTNQTMNVNGNPGLRNSLRNKQHYHHHQHHHHYAMGQNDVTPLSSSSSNTPQDQGMFSWIWITFKLHKEQILMHTGPDAVYYLSFQKHLMLVMAIVTLVSLLIILPVNFFNGLPKGQYDVNAFGRTTMANLSPDSSWLWIHVIVTIIYVPLIVLIMRRSSGRNAFKRAATRTIIITNISSNDRHRMIIRNYIQELFPDVNIEDVQIAYNISKLHGRNSEYERILDARIYCEQHRDRDTLMVRSNWCSCKREKAYDYYEREERALHGDVARLKAAALNKPLGIAFLTLSTVQEAQNILNHFTPGTYRQWSLAFAPSPDDLFWENLNVSSGHWMLKWATVNIILFLMLFFLTTPAMIVNLWDAVPKDGIKDRISPLVSEFLPTLMLWILSVLMPVIVTFSDKWMSHYTRSKQNYSIMTKCFAYLLFMILILPSLGLTSAQAFLEWSISSETMRWQCIFLPDRGSFYVNYVITAAFIGTSLELLRFPELIVYMWMLITARSKAETPYIRRSILIEFPFGSHYAWTTLVSTIAIVYSVFCPLIMPFAMIYISFKHFVDRYNLYFAYGPSNMLSRNGGKIHSTAVTMTKFSVVLLLLIMAMISAIRGAGMARAMVLTITLVITLTLFTFMSPIKRCANARRPSIVEIAGPAPIYIPDELKQRPMNSASTMMMSPMASSSSHSSQSPYGKSQQHEMMPTVDDGNGGTNSNVRLNNRIESNITTTTTGGGYGSDSVSDFDISSQHSAPSVVDA